MLVRSLRTKTTRLFINCEQQSDIVDTFSAQTLGCTDLRGDDALRITRTATVDKLLILTRLNKRRHRVHVRREYDARRLTRGCDYIETICGCILFLNSIAQILEKCGQILANPYLVAGQRWNI